MSNHQLSLFVSTMLTGAVSTGTDDPVEDRVAPPWNVKKDGIWSVIHPTSKLKEAVRNDALRTIAFINDITAKHPTVRTQVKAEANIMRMKRAAKVLAMYAGISCPNYFRGHKKHAK